MSDNSLSSCCNYKNTTKYRLNIKGYLITSHHKEGKLSYGDDCYFYIKRTNALAKVVNLKHSGTHLDIQLISDIKFRDALTRVSDLEQKRYKEIINDKKRKTSEKKVWYILEVVDDTKHKYLYFRTFDNKNAYQQELSHGRLSEAAGEDLFYKTGLAEERNVAAKVEELQNKYPDIRYY